MSEDHQIDSGWSSRPPPPPPGIHSVEAMVYVAVLATIMALGVLVSGLRQVF